jgi:hypothetical protein
MNRRAALSSYSDPIGVTAIVSKRAGLPGLVQTAKRLDRQAESYAVNSQAPSSETLEAVFLDADMHDVPSVCHQVSATMRQSTLVISSDSLPLTRAKVTHGSDRAACGCRVAAVCCLALRRILV